MKGGENVPSSVTMEILNKLVFSDKGERGEVEGSKVLDTNLNLQLVKLYRGPNKSYL